MRLIGSHIIAIFTPKITGLEQCQPRADGSFSFYGQRISRRRPGPPYAPESSFSTTQLLQNLQEASKRPAKHLESPINNHVGIIFKLCSSHVDAMCHRLAHVSELSLRHQKTSIQGPRLIGMHETIQYLYDFHQL